MISSGTTESVGNTDDSACHDSAIPEDFTQHSRKLVNKFTSRSNGNPDLHLERYWVSFYDTSAIPCLPISVQHLGMVCAYVDHGPTRPRDCPCPQLIIVSRSSASSLHLLPSSQVHRLGQQGHHVRVESLPVGVVQVVLLRGFLLVTFDNGELGLVLQQPRCESADAPLLRAVRYSPWGPA
jgi:hypothetical protein